MQKAVGSSPIIRSLEPAVNSGFLVVRAAQNRRRRATIAVLGYFLNRRAISGEAADRKAQLALLERQVEGDAAAFAATGTA